VSGGGDVEREGNEVARCCAQVLDEHTLVLCTRGWHVVDEMTRNSEVREVRRVSVAGEFVNLEDKGTGLDVRCEVESRAYEK
jgi:hypothetical protein